MKLYSVQVAFEVRADNEWDAMNKIADELARREQTDQLPYFKIVDAEEMLTEDSS